MGSSCHWHNQMTLAFRPYQLLQHQALWMVLQVLTHWLLFLLYGLVWKHLELVEFVCFHIDSNTFVIVEHNGTPLLRPLWLRPWYHFFRIVWRTVLRLLNCLFVAHEYLCPDFAINAELLPLQGPDIDANLN